MRNLLVVIILTIILSSCASTKYVEVPIPQIKIEYRDRTFIDTLIRNDSTVIREKGDTILIEKYKYIYKTKELRDTINVTDTVTVVKTVEVTKTVNRLNNWQTVLMAIGLSSIVLLIIRVYKWIRGRS